MTPVAANHPTPPAASTRRRPRRTARSTTAPSMAPMIDVVFLLLMYFLLAADFSSREEIYRVDLPPQELGSGESDPFRLDQDPLRIGVTTTGPRRDDVRVALVEPYPAAENLAALEHFLRRAIVGAELGLFAPDHPVLIEPGPEASWEHAVAVFDIAVKSGYTNVIFVRLP